MEQIETHKDNHIFMVNWFSTKVSRHFIRERITFSNSPETTGYSHAKKNEIEFYYTPQIKINSKWIIELNVKAKIIRSTRINFDLVLGNSFWHMTPKAQTTKEKNR